MCEDNGQCLGQRAAAATLPDSLFLVRVFALVAFPAVALRKANTLLFAVLVISLLQRRRGSGGSAPFSSAFSTRLRLRFSLALRESDGELKTDGICFLLLQRHGLVVREGTLVTASAVASRVVP